MVLIDVVEIDPAGLSLAIGTIRIGAEHRPQPILPRIQIEGRAPFASNCHLFCRCLATRRPKVRWSFSPLLSQTMMATICYLWLYLMF